MKKHLIAAAVAGAFAVPAMAQVNISGNLNITPFDNAKTVTTTSSGATTVKTSGAARTGQVTTEGWTASQLAFSGEEDLGGGLKASFVVTSRLNNNATQNNAVWGGRDTNIALMGGFGTVRMGRFVPASAGYHGFTGARTTNQSGNLYGGIITGGSALWGNAADNANFERQPSLLQYTSPSISGLTVNVSYNVDRSDTSATTGDADVSQTGLGLSYAAGPLRVAVGLNSREANTEGNTSLESDLNWVGASYNLGVASITASHILREAKLSTAGAAALKVADVTVNAVGISVPMGAMTIGASTYSGDNPGAAGTGDDLELSGYQVSVTYALSKRTMIYAAMGENKTKRDAGNTTGTTTKATSNAIGVMHSF